MAGISSVFRSRPQAAGKPLEGYDTRGRARPPDTRSERLPIKSKNLAFEGMRRIGSWRGSGVAISRKARRSLCYAFGVAVR